MNPKESSESAKYRALNKAYRNELRKPNPDKEVLLALSMEIRRIDSNTPRDTLGGGSYTLNLIKK